MHDEEKKMEWRIVKPCSTEKKKKNRKRGRSAEPEQSRWGLSRCYAEPEKKGKSSVSLEPLITTVTTTTTCTTTITILTPPEEPNVQVNLYLCLQHIHKSGTVDFTWVTIDPSKFEEQLISLSPLSHMPPTTPKLFRPVANSHSPSAAKLIYAFGGREDPHIYYRKSFVCDLSQKNLVWEELPPMPLPMKVLNAVVSPLDGKIYLFGVMPIEPYPKYATWPTAPGGLIFDPSSRSWTTGPSGVIRCHSAETDYTLVHNKIAENEHHSKLVVFNSLRNEFIFDLSRAEWEYNDLPNIPREPYAPHEPYASCVGVGNMMYRFTQRKLYALDSTLAKPYFEQVRGFEKKLPTHWETNSKGYLAYLGKGKMCIVWGLGPRIGESSPEGGIVYITCLMFWVGMCSRKNRLHAVIDRCHRYVASGSGFQLYDVVAL